MTHGVIKIMLILLKNKEVRAMEIIQTITNITTIIANTAVIISAIIALRQLFIMKKTHEEEHTRNLRQSTIEFYNEINKETKEFIDEVMIGTIDLKVETILADVDLHKRVRRYLSLMERFSVGINSYMYDIVVFDRIQGKTTLVMYDNLKPYIDHISEKYGTYFYGEFIKVIEQIKDIRKKRRDCGYSDRSEKFPNTI